jgi:hypothetical protein
MDGNYENHPLVLQLDRELMPRLRQVALDLGQSLSRAEVSVFYGPVGTATKHQGLQIGIECIFSDPAASEPDNAAFMVSACHLDREPRLTADVCWGHPSGHVEACIDDGSSEQWPLATPCRISEIITQTPRLLSAFAVAARRGHP